MKSNLFTSMLKTMGPSEAFEFRCCGSQVNQEVNLQPVQQQTLENKSH